MRHAAAGRLAAVLAAFLGLSGVSVLGHAEHPDDDDNAPPGAQVLTRGPVHEAFAGVVTFDPEPGVVVTKAPPTVIEEMPPEERPEGDNVTWIPGYWGWDDERGDFLWVSGTWRALPPGREWIAGYWGQTPQGYQWTSGYWADAAARETTYLPPPPVTVEVGPNIAAPSVDYVWVPGCWVWHHHRYAWRPGYWALGRTDWDWIPAHYVWSPRGYIFIGGFWDYPVVRRGVIFAPVYFDPGASVRVGFAFSPRIVINLGVFSDHLFLRPHFHHYYFGDYYAPSYHQSGFYASFSFHSSRRGYDPFYSHQRWEHRRDRNWERRVETSYHHRRDHENARPPRTWADQRSYQRSAPESRASDMRVAAPLRQVAQRPDGAQRFQPVAREERQQLARRSQEVQQSREQRRTLEARPATVTAAAQRPGGVAEPVKVQLPRSPIVSRPIKQLEKGQAPPQAPRAPKPNLKVQPRSEAPSRPADVNRSSPPTEPRKPGAEQRPTPRRSEAAPLQRPVQPVPQAVPQAAPQPRVQEPGSPARRLERPTQPDTEQRAKDAAAKAQQDSQRNSRVLQQPTRPEVQPWAKAPPTRMPAAAPQNSQRASPPALRPKSTAGEKGATQLMKGNRSNNDKDKPSSTRRPPPKSP